MGRENPQVILVPWDPESTAHVERLYQQRIACGWNKHAVESWRDLQREGKIALHWVVLSDSDISKDSRLAQHVKIWPSESISIQDTASSLGGKTRAAAPETTFIPVGHISLDSENEDSSLANASKGLYRISTFYISTALQSGGLGRAAMDLLESMATSEPLNARTLTLMTVANEYEGKKEKLEAFRQAGGEQPEESKISAQDWYTRRGYEAYRYVDKTWSKTDSQGRVWWTTAVLMRKDIKMKSVDG